MLFKSVLMMFANNSESISYHDLDILSNKGRCSERLSDANLLQLKILNIYM